MSMVTGAPDPDVEVFRDLVEGLPIALVVVRPVDADPTGWTIVAANPAALELLDHDGPTVGARLSDVVRLPPEILDSLTLLAGGEDPHITPSVEVAGIDGTFSVRTVPLPGRHIGLSIEDVTARSRTAAALRHQATHDDLTGLANRVLLHERLDGALAESERTGEPVAVLLVDLDQFKDVNDTLGHDHGDALLRELGHRMATRLRSCDTVARLGGDEFAVLLTTDVSPESVREVARRLTALAAEPVHLDRYRLQVSASVGIAIAPQHGTDAATILNRADTAMYEAKDAGGGHSILSRGWTVDVDRRSELLADLRRGDFPAELEVLFQPRVELQGMTVVGLEALARWHHPRLGVLTPGDFIELAEVSGGIRALTQAVTAQACHALDVLDRLDGQGRRTVNINISTRNLVDPEWVDSVCETLADSGLAPGRLWMELTEPQLMDDPRQSAPALERLHLAGVRFSIDDFGSGASSLAQVRDLPVDEVKIDPRFIDDLRRGDDRIVRSIIDLGHHLGLLVTAEGVADFDTLDALREMGCGLAQGWALSPPLPFEGVLEHLTDTSRPTPPAAWKGPVTDR